MEQQQQSLFDVSIIKLQHEQLRHGVEPRLLRFVLINNALRSLQGHMLHIEEEESLVGLGDEFQCDSSDIFFYNTFKNGSLSVTPLSPPTQVKVMKLEGSLNDQSPLIEYQEAPATPLSTGGSHDTLTPSSEEDRVHPAAPSYEEGLDSEGEEGEEEEGGRDRRLLNGFNDAHGSGVHLGKRSREWSANEQGAGGVNGLTRDSSRCRSSAAEVGLNGAEGQDVKKVCKPSSLIINAKVQNGLNGLNGLNGFLDLDPFPSLVLPSSPPSPTSSTLSVSSPLTPHYQPHPHYSSAAEDTDRDSTPSPIDFTNVDLDPTLYVFDTAVLQVDSADQHVSLPSIITPPEAVSSSHVTTAPSRVTSSSSHVAESPLMSSCHVTMAPDHVTMTPDHVTLSSDHVTLSSDHVTLSSDHVTVSPDHVSSDHTGPVPVSTGHVTAAPDHVPMSTGHVTVASDHVPMSTGHVTMAPDHVIMSNGLTSQVKVVACHVTKASIIASSVSTVTTPLHSSVLTTSVSPVLSRQPPGDDTAASPDVSLPCSSTEPEKLSVVSADSTVLAAVPPSSVHGGSCAMEAIVRAQNGELSLGEGSRLSHDRGGPLGGDNLTSASEGVETDYMDEIDHIVNLLMT